MSLKGRPRLQWCGHMRWRLVGLRLSERQGSCFRSKLSVCSSEGACNSVTRPYKAETWGYVGNDHSVPSVAAIKQALCTHGPLAVALKATPLWSSYTGGVFNEPGVSGINHGVTLVGWDDGKQAWLIEKFLGNRMGQYR